MSLTAALFTFHTLYHKYPYKAFTGHRSIEMIDLTMFLFAAFHVKKSINIVI